MIYSVRLKTATTLDSSLITLAEAKNFLRVTVEDASEDTRISNLVKASRQAIEESLNRTILTSTWLHRIDNFPIGQIQLMKNPVQSVTSVKYYDVAGAQQTLVEDTDYRVDIYTGRINTVTGTYWPTTETEKFNAVEVEYIAGYTVVNVPPGIKNGILYKLWENYHGDMMGSQIESSINFYRNQIF